LPRDTRSEANIAIDIAAICNFSFAHLSLEKIVLLVPTYVRESEIHGLGVFAAEPIAKGAEVWAFHPGLDRIITLPELLAFPEHMIDFLEIYCEYFADLNVLVLSGDNDRYTNHADDPNTVVVLPNAPHAKVIAARDIAAGEEITCDYAVIRSRKWSGE
jgi:hypothetical protein